MRSITHKCRENDAVIKVYFKDKAIEELQVKIQGEKGWTVIGYMDLQKAIATAIKKMDYVVKEQNSGGYIGEAEIENERIAQSIYKPCKFGCNKMITDLQDKNAKLRLGLGKLLQICKNTKMNEESVSWEHFMGFAQQMMDETDPNGKWNGIRL